MEYKTVCGLCKVTTDCLNDVTKLNICKNIPLSEALFILCKEPILYICISCCQLIEAEYIQNCLNSKIKEEMLESCDFEEDALEVVKIEEVYNGILKSEHLSDLSNQRNLNYSSDVRNRDDQNKDLISEILQEPLVANCVINAAQCKRNSQCSKGICHVTTTKSLECNECNKIFNNPTKFQQHMRVVHVATSPVTCNECHKIFKYKMSLLHHIRTIHNQNELVKCNECNKIFDNPIYLKNHVKRIHSYTPLKCNECEKIFKGKYTLLHHIRTNHNKIESVKCNECNNIFKNPTNLKDHVKRVHSYTPLKCNECHKIFKCKRTLLYHIRTIHNQNELVKCNECNKILDNPIYLKNHVKLVHSYTALKCNKCHKIFTCKYTLLRHIRTIHNKHEPIKCNECNKSFNNQIYLKKHLKCVHSSATTIKNVIKFSLNKKT